MCEGVGVEGVAVGIFYLGIECCVSCRLLLGLAASETVSEFFMSSH